MKISCGNINLRSHNILQAFKHCLLSPSRNWILSRVKKSGGEHDTENEKLFIGSLAESITENRWFCPFSYVSVAWLFKEKKKTTHETTFHTSSYNGQRKYRTLRHSIHLRIRVIIMHFCWFMCHFCVSKCWTETTN